MKKSFKVLMFVFVASLAGCRGVDRAGAEAWVHDNLPGAKLSCMSNDSDWDGYISCTATYSDGRPPVPLKCAAEYTMILEGGCAVAYR